jgi:hypothetical protein
MSKIAPGLSWHIQEPFGSDPAALRSAVPEMVRELRALKAVAKAAQQASLGMFIDDQGVWRLSKDATPAVTALRRALARLQRPQGERP